MLPAARARDLRQARPPRARASTASPSTSALLAPYDVRIVAEKVETAEERDACLELGIDLFQGYFFERPRLVRGRPTPHAALRRLRIATSLGADATFEDVERVVAPRPGPQRAAAALHQLRRRLAAPAASRRCATR